jgi:hypothetical protein
MGKIVVLALWLLTLPALAKIAPKTPNDVFAYATLLREEVSYLRKQAGIEDPFPTVRVQRNKEPRHVIQKALEILAKINRYRINHKMGAITIPPYPPREITPQDVYDIVKRLNGEVRLLIGDDPFIASLSRKRFTGKTPSDVYELLWSISLGFDALLGIRGYTPTDVYALSEKVVRISEFLRHSQNLYDSVERPAYRPNLHPNHALYASIDFLKKVATGQKRLWIEPADVPQKPHRVITPTEVYDSLQYDIAELQRIKYRLGIERYFEIEKPSEEKTPSDVVRNLEYAKRLLPDFSFDRPLVQYPPVSLKKTPNQVYAVTEEIMKKLEILRTMRGVHMIPKDPPKIYGLKPIHTYQKGIEAIEKAQRLKVQMGFYPSQIPDSPFRAITPSEVYELILRLDGIVTLLLKKAGDREAKEYIYMTNHPIYTGRSPSDVYFNLWRISRLFDMLSGSEYTPNETYALAKKIYEKSRILADHLKVRKVEEIARVEGKRPKDVFHLTKKLNDRIRTLQKRANMNVTVIEIPEEKTITPNTVYNALRIINASVNEVLIQLGIDAEDVEAAQNPVQGKTPSDVYAIVERTVRQIDQLFRNENYGR